jgi:hypothetical protein
MGMENVLRYPASHGLPSHRLQWHIASDTAAQGIKIPAGYPKALEDFFQLGFRLSRREDQDIMALQLGQGLLPGEEVKAGRRRRQIARRDAGEGAQFGIKAGEPKPFGQTAQGGIYEESHFSQPPRIGFVPLNQKKAALAMA